MIMSVSHDSYVYLVNRVVNLGLVTLLNNCQLKLGKVQQVNSISVISEVGVLLKCLVEIVWKSPGNLFGWICTHPDIKLFISSTKQERLSLVGPLAHRFFKK